MPSYINGTKFRMKTQTLLLVLVAVAACIVGVYAVSTGWLPRYVEAPANGAMGRMPDASEPLRQEKPAPHTNTPAANQPASDVGETSGPPKRERRKLAFAAIRFDYSELPDDAQGTLTVRWYGGSNASKFESPLEKRPESTHKNLSAATYYVMIVGGTTWRSEPVTLAEHDEVTVVLGHGPSQTVSVAVTDAATGEPLEGAALMLYCKCSPGNAPKEIDGLIALTDEQGRATLQGQPVQEMKYTVEKHGYEPVDLFSHPLQGGDCFLGTIALERAAGTFKLVYDLTGLELKEGETAEVETKLDNPSEHRYPNGSRQEQVVSGELFWDDISSEELAGARVFNGLAKGRRHITGIYVWIRDTRGQIVRTAQYINNYVYDTTDTITVTAKDLRIRER